MQIFRISQFGTRVKLSIWDDDPEWCLGNLFEDLLTPEWEKGLNKVSSAYEDKRLAVDGYEQKLRGLCEICEGICCEPKDPSNNIWKL